MCGIAGIITRAPENIIGPMLAKIEHRGRDDEGVWISDGFGSKQLKVALGHRRLSIIDTSSAGHQPFHSSDGRFSITYNGEIYNFKEIRSQLEAKGHSFLTASDTEVLIKAFETWGIACLEKLNGMFAFAVWDDIEKSLTLVRDRAGIKPLYYTQTGDSLIFASEIKAILASRLVKPELDHEGFNQFLTFLWPVPPQTLFKNIYHLPAAHYLVWKDGQINIRQWWDLDFSQEDNSGKPDSYWQEQVAETLEKVVQMEMISDVPLGAFLSGGVDSSAITALMTRHSTKKVSTYTTAISADDLSYDIIPDDVKWSRIIAETFPIDYHETLQTPDLAELLPKLVYHQDAPVIDMAIPSYLISKQSRESLKVMLSGMGGDEIFAGYPRHMAMAVASKTDFIPTSVRRPLMKAFDKLLYGGLRGKFTAPIRNAKKFSKSAAMNFEDRYLGFGTYFTDEMKTGLLTEGLGEEIKQFDAYEHHRRYFDACRTATPLNRLLYVDFKTFMPALNLDTTDRTSMAANLEVRVPYLNHELVSLSEKIPSTLKIKGLTRKFVLKKAVEEFLPKEVIWRKKAGFSAPIRSWIRGSLRPLIDDLLSEETVKKRGLFDPNEVRRLIELNESGKEDLNLQIFQLLTFEIWAREFLD